MKPRNSPIVYYFIFLATWLEWEKQELYLQNSLPATSYPLRKYPNLSVAQVLCWWGYHRTLFSGGRTKHRDSHQCVKHSSQQNWIFGIFSFMKKRAEIWKRWMLDTKTWHSWLAEPWLKANCSLNEHEHSLMLTWCLCWCCSFFCAGSHPAMARQELCHRFKKNPATKYIPNVS